MKESVTGVIVLSCSPNKACMCVVIEAGGEGGAVLKPAQVSLECEFQVTR